MKKKITIILIILLVLTLAWYSYYQTDKENLKIDYYNFQQLWKAKKVVEKFEKSWKRLPLPVRSLYDFNYGYTWDFRTWFEANIHPINKNYCYDVYYDKNPTWPWYVFTFWFKLHSKLWKLLNGWEYYNYPYKMKKPEPSEECKRDRESAPNVWIRWAPPSCVWGTYYWRYMEIVNNPCIKE